MPRDLGDVLDYFLPAAPPAEGMARRSAEPRRAAAARRAERPAVLPIVAVPIGDRDVVRAAFAWNLVVELARMGVGATLLAPADAEPSLLWPAPGPGPLGAEVVLASAGGLPELNRAALDIAVTRAADVSEGGLVVVRVPPRWLLDGSDARALLRWALVFATPDPRDLRETYGVVKQLVEANPEAEVGIAIHGTRRVAEARDAFHRVAEVAARHLGRVLLSYGLLVDDLHVYRAIVARRPIGLEHPQSRAALALRDVARLLVEDARKHTLV